MISSISLARYAPPAPVAAASKPPAAAKPQDSVQLTGSDASKKFLNQAKVTAGVAGMMAGIFAAPAALGAVAGPAGALVGVAVETAGAYYSTRGMNVGRGAIVGTALIGSAVSGALGTCLGWPAAAVIAGVGAAIGVYASFQK